jgi:Open reading frame 2 N-terminal domain
MIEANMNTILIYAISILLALIFLLSGAVSAQRRMPPGAGAGELSGLAGGLRLNIGGREFELIPSAAVVQRGALAQRRGPLFDAHRSDELRAAGLPALRVHVVRSSVIFYERSAAGALALSAEKGLVSYPVVRDLRTRRIGYLNGQLKARIKPGANPQTIALDSGLNLYAYFPESGWAFFNVAPGRDLGGALARLRAFNSVESAELELVQELNRPQ